MHRIQSLVVRRRRFALLALAAIVPCVGLVLTASRMLRSADDSAPAATLQLQSGDHICMIGNTLADRMQHDGWLETYLYSRFPKQNLVIRDLGFSGDELTFGSRSAGFGSPDEHLAFSKADVVFAFFGYNESYAGAAGSRSSRRIWTDFIKHTQSAKIQRPQRRRGSSSFRRSPMKICTIATCPTAAQNNARLELYTAAMAEVAKANNVPFVDLYEPTLISLRQSRPAADDQRHPSQRARQRGLGRNH